MSREAESTVSPVRDAAGARWQRGRARLVFVGLMLAVYLGVGWWQHRGLVSGPAPALAAPLLDGSRFSLSAYADRPVLVYFWGSWCPVCRLEQDTVMGLAADWPAVTVAMQSGSDAELSAWLRERQLEFPVVNDPDGTLAASWGVRAVPAFFVVDRGGVIRFREVGYTSGVGLRLRLWWAGIV